MPEYYFNLPSYEVLTPAQQAAVTDEIPIALSGGPGTGKSVVSLWRHLVNHSKEEPIRSQLLTFTTSLSFYLKACSRTQSQIAADYVDSALNWVTHYATMRAEIIIDEAQDLPLEFNRSLRNYSDKISYGADDQQILKPNSNPGGVFDIAVCSPEEYLRKEFRHNALHQLNRNFRSTQKIMQFAKEMFRQAYIPDEIIRGLKSRAGESPRLLISGGDASKENAAILELIGQFNDRVTNIAVLVPFARPPGGIERYTARYYYDLISGSGVECSYYDYTMNRLEIIKNVHITPFKSAKGLEFDVVILPNFHLVNQAFRVVEWRDFFVGVTRAKNNLFLISSTDIQVKDSFIEKIVL